MSSNLTPCAAWAFAATQGTPAAGSHTDPDRQAAHLACQRAVRAVFGADACLSLISRPGRAPLASVSSTRGIQRPRVSLSHRTGVGVAIVSRADDAVGIDVERVDAVSSEQQRYFLSRRERIAAAPLSPTALWSLKEAAWKALELDASVPFHELELEFSGASLKSTLFRGARRKAHATITAVEPGFVVATVQMPSAS